jgi:hypothetical protein
MNDIASVDPGASNATWRIVAAVAVFVRYMVTPAEATIAGCLASKPASLTRSIQEPPASIPDFLIPQAAERT